MATTAYQPTNVWPDVPVITAPYDDFEITMSNSTGRMLYWSIEDKKPTGSYSEYPSIARGDTLSHVMSEGEKLWILSPETAATSTKHTLRIIHDLFPLTLTGTPDGANVGRPYSWTPTAPESVSPQVYTISSGTLPDGLFINASTGEISGLPTEVDDVSITILLTDGLGRTASLATSIVVTTFFQNSISVTSGSGYAGSTYTAALADQWTADGEDIAGETGATYVLTVQDEGKAIACGNSNAITKVTPMTSDNLVAYWDFSESAAPFFSKRGRLSGSVPMNFVKNTGVTKVAAGPHGSAIDMDGNTILGITPGNIGPLDMGAAQRCTVIAWISRDLLVNGACIAGVWQEFPGNPQRQYALFMDLDLYGGNDRVCGHVSYTGGVTPGFPYSIDYSTSARLIDVDEWVMAVFTYDGAEAVSYVNGLADFCPEYTATNGETSVTKVKNPYPWTDGLHPSVATYFTVGGSNLDAGGVNIFNGKIGALAVWDRALTPEEIMQMRYSRGTYTKVDFLTSYKTLNTIPPQSLGWRINRSGTDYSGETSAGGIVGRTGGGFVVMSPSGGYSGNEIMYMPFKAIPSDKATAYSMQANSNPGGTTTARLAVRIDGQHYVSDTTFALGAGNDADTWTNAVTWSIADINAAQWRPVTIVDGVSMTVGSAGALPVGELDAIGWFSSVRTNNIRGRNFHLTYVA